MNRDNPKGFNEAALKVIEALGGDMLTGKCFCPVHDDGQRPSLQVSNGDKWPVVIHCFGGGRNHDHEVIAKLRQMGVWPTSTKLSSAKASTAAEQKRSGKERLEYALDIWNKLLQCNGHRFAPLLKDYLKNRGIKRVPDTALMTHG